MVEIPYAKRYGAKRRTSAKRPREFPDARGGVVDPERRSGGEAYRGNAAGQPQRRSVAPGRKTDGGARDYAAADGRRFGEDHAGARDDGDRSGAGRILVRDSDHQSEGRFLGHRLPRSVQSG